MFVRLRSLFHHLNRATMSTTIHNTNVACCTIPGVKSDYSPKGTIKSYGGFEKVCLYTLTYSRNGVALLRRSIAIAQMDDRLCSLGLRYRSREAQCYHSRLCL